MTDASHRYAPRLPKYRTWMEDTFRPQWSRSWVRLNAILLLREQAELIRSARTQVQVGKFGNIAEFDSIVIPGAKWLVIGDAKNNSVSLKLTPIPLWARDCEEIPRRFFLLPLDGSKSWKFRPRFAAAVENNVSTQ